MIGGAAEEKILCYSPPPKVNKPKLLGHQIEVCTDALHYTSLLEVNPDKHSHYQPARLRDILLFLDWKFTN